MVDRVVGKLYPIPIDDYPKLLRYKVTQNGIYYIEELMREVYIEKKELSMNKLTQLGLLLKTYVCQTKRIEEEILFQDISKKARKFGGTEQWYVKECIKKLMMRGFIGSNLNYDPKIAINMHKKRI